jgi:hypothetical protein
LWFETQLVMKKEPASREAKAKGIKKRYRVFAFPDPVSGNNNGVAHQKTP